MSSSHSRPTFADASMEDSGRFKALFGREPDARSLTRFRAAHDALALGVPARLRRRTARILTRL